MSVSGKKRKEKKGKEKRKSKYPFACRGNETDPAFSAALLKVDRAESVTDAFRAEMKNESGETN